MYLWRLAGVFAAICMFAAPAFAAPLEAYGKLPNIEEALISPSGERLALIVTNGESRMLVVQDLVAGKPLTRATAGQTKIRGIRWAGENHIIIVNSVTAAPMFLLGGKREWMMAHLFDIATGKARPLLENTRKAAEAMNVVLEMPVVREIDGEPTIFLQGLTFPDNQGVLSIFKTTTRARVSVLTETGVPNTRDWIIGPDGQTLAHELYDDRTGRWSVRLRGPDGWREAASVTALQDRPYTVGLGRDARSVLVATTDDEERSVWRELRADGVEGEPLPVADEQTAVRDPSDGRLVGYATLVGDKGGYTFFDPTDAKIWKAVTAAYPNDSVQFVSWSKNHRKIVVLVDSPTEGPAYALVDLDTKRGRWIGAQYSGLNVPDIAVKTPMKFKAADGRELSGYLTLPSGKTAKALPLIVFPHGGPASRDAPGFDWWAQGMASRGYGVLQVNFRGSDGLGDELLTAGYGQWGRKMQTDLSDGVRHLAKEGVVDPKRVCIVGASYGGYAALAGATHDPGVYRCAVAVAGVSDLKRQVVYGRNNGGRSTLRYWTRFMGAKDVNDPVLAAYSPAQHAAKAEIPILLIHGKDDTVVPLDQSRVMAAALEKAGKPYELVVQPGADHWLSQGATRLQTLTATMAFVEKHNPPN